MAASRIGVIVAGLKPIAISRRTIVVEPPDVEEGLGGVPILVRNVEVQLPVFSTWSLNDVIRPCQDRWRDRQTKTLGNPRRRSQNVQVAVGVFLILFGVAVLVFRLE